MTRFGGGGHVDRVGGEQPLDLEAVHDGHDRVGCVFEVHVGPGFAEFACFGKGLGDEDAQSRVALAEVLLGGVAFGVALRRQDGMVRLIGCVPEDVELTVGEFLRLLNQGRLRDVRLGRGRRTSENAVGDAGRPGEVDGVPPSVRGPVTDEAGRRPKGAPVRPSFARQAGTELPTSPPMRRVRHHADVAPPTVRINGWWGRAGRGRMLRMTLPTPELRTARLRLRPFTDADAASLYALHSSANVLRYWDSPPWTEPARAQRFIATCRTIEEEGTGARVAVDRVSDGAFIGWCGLTRWNPDFRSASWAMSSTPPRGATATPRRPRTPSCGGRSTPWT